MTIARAIATRCCWPPDSSVGSWSSRSPRPSRSSAAVARATRSRRADALVEERRRDVVERRRPRQQVVGLEDEPDRPAPQPGQRRRRRARRPACRRGGSARGRPVEAADDVHHRALARAGRPDDRDELALADLERDVAQGVDPDALHRVGPADPVEADDRLGHRQLPGRAAEPPPPPPPARRSPAAARGIAPVPVVVRWVLLVPVTTTSPGIQAALDLDERARDQADGHRTRLGRARRGR